MLIVAALSLIATTATVARAQEPEPQWRPIQAGNGERYLFQQLGQGHVRFRMSPQQLQATLGKLQAEAGALAGAAAGLNLPASVKRAPGAAMQLVRTMAEKMGGADKIYFYSPPRFDFDITSFSFTDGKRFVDVHTSKVGSQSLLSPMVTVKVFRREGEREIVERSVHVQLHKKTDDVLQQERERGRPYRGALDSPWTKATLRLEGRGGRRWVEYTRLPGRKGLWFGRKSSTREGSPRAAGRFVLRSPAGAGGGRAKEVPVKGMTAERLYILSNLNRYRTRMPKWHRRYDARHMTFDDVSTDLLRGAGVQTVVDGRGRVYLRGGGARLDRAPLREAGLTYVGRSRDGRRAHLRHLRPARSGAK